MAPVSGPNVSGGGPVMVVQNSPGMPQLPTSSGMIPFMDRRGLILWLCFGCSCYVICFVDFHWLMSP